MSVCVHVCMCLSCGYGYPTEKTLNNDRRFGENAELNDWFCRIEMLWYVSALMWYTIVQNRQVIVALLYIKPLSNAY